MPYAIKLNSWRAINSEADLQPGEEFSLVAPPSIPEPSAVITTFSEALTAPDFFVATPDINDDPEKALDEAIKEMEKGVGSPKSIALIALSMAKWAKMERENNKALKAEIEELKKKVK